MELKEKSLELKDKVVAGLRRWAGSRIDQFVADNPSLAPAGKYLKRGVSNLIAREDGQLAKGIDKLMLFIVDEQGNYSMDMLMDDALSMFKTMPETPFDMGLFRGTIGNGMIRVQLPDNPLVSLFMGNTGAIRITEADFKELKHVLCSQAEPAKPSTSSCHKI